MIEVRQTAVFRDWIRSLRDARGVQRINQRILRLQGGLFGDVKSVGAGVSELRIDYGPGYRLYFTRQGATLVLLLVGGDKGSQDRDIDRAKQMVKEL